MRFPAKKNAGCPKAPCDFPPRKDGILCPRRVVLGLPSPLPQSVRTDGRTDVRTDGHVTITSQPKFLGLMGYHISLAMELRWRALPAGSAIRLHPNNINRDSGIEIPEAWIPTIRKHNSRPTTKRTCEGTTSNSRNNNEDRNAPIAANHHATNSDT